MTGLNEQGMKLDDLHNFSDLRPRESQHDAAAREKGLRVRDNYNKNITTIVFVITI